MKTWFKHDYNARNDEKLVNLSMKEGMEGLAIYWCIIEMLYENNGYIENNCDRIAFALHSQSDKVSKVISDYFLFSLSKKDNLIFNSRVLTQLKEIDNISEKARINAKIKWNKYYATAKRPQSGGNATAMQIEKRREEKKENIIIAGKPAIDKSNLLNKFKFPLKDSVNKQWQDEALNATSILNCSETKKSSIFKCFKDNVYKARIALSDCKELGKLNEFYFLKVYNELIKKI